MQTRQPLLYSWLGGHVKVLHRPSEELATSALL